MLSIIITTKNEEKNIVNCIESINNSQTKINYEILVIDNFSNDKTSELATQYSNVKFINHGNERSSQRNQGIEISRYDNILYLDADMMLSINLLDEICEQLNKNCDALYIPEKILGNSLLNKLRNYERQFYNSTYIDCVRAFKKNVFYKIGGFDINLVGPEDWDFNNKIIDKKYIISTTKNLIFHNEENITFITYLKKKLYYSKSMAKYIQKWGKESKFVSFQLSFFSRFFMIFFINKNYKLIFKNPAYFILMYLLKILVGSLYLFRKN